MVEYSVYKALRDFDLSQDAVIATQVFYKGSLPRKDYPSLLVFNDGRTFGTVGGGAMESDVINKARELLGNNNCLIEDFDLRGKNITEIDGVCGGETKILFEPVVNNVRKFWLDLNKKTKENPEIAAVIIVDKNKNNIEKHIFADLVEVEDKDIDSEIKNKIKNAFKQKKSIQVDEKETLVLINYLKKNIILHIFGAGHVGKAVYDLARFVEYDVNIYDDRKDLANYNRFPMANLVNTNDVKTYKNEVKIQPEDYVLIATRGHQHDYELLKWLIKEDIAYIGMLCSTRKLALINKELKKEGIELSLSNNIFAPVGLDIKSETVPEIAVSIIAEIIEFNQTGKASTLKLSELDNRGEDE